MFAPKSVLIWQRPDSPDDLQFCGEIVKAEAYKYTGSKIDEQYFEWLKIWYELTGQERNYAKTDVFICGDVAEVVEVIGKTRFLTARAYIVKEYATNIDAIEVSDIPIVSLDRLPRLIPGIGVYYPRAFDNPSVLFEGLKSSHDFICLTESNKPSTGSYRRGVYITGVTETEEGKEFKLLRCSTNFTNPTEDRNAIDDSIIERVNEFARINFDDPAELDHVLAQIYDNRVVEGKHKKGRIIAHSDKTKDMPRNALMAFVTLYDKDDVDYSEATTMVWKEKHSDGKVEKLPLHPGSVLLVNMETNRLWTHEIVPPFIPVDKCPTRMGYVVRCSKTTAVFKDGKTHIKTEDGELVEMRKPTSEDMAELKGQYWLENSTTDIVTYTSATHGSTIPYSMNDGDYMEPKLCTTDFFD